MVLSFLLPMLYMYKKRNLNLTRRGSKMRGKKKNRAFDGCVRVCVSVVFFYDQ